MLARVSQLSGVGLVPTVEEVVPGAEAEDIFDSFVGQMAGRGQPAEPPSPGAWQVLFDQMQAFAEAAPWDRWADDIDFGATLELAGKKYRVNGVVMGNAGIQPGLALFPGEVVEIDGEGPAPPWPYEAGTLACTLDDPTDIPAEITARASRYGWPRTLRIVPSFFGMDQGGGRDFSAQDADLFCVLTAAVVAHDRHYRRPSAKAGAPTNGKVLLSGSRTTRFSVRHRQRDAR